MPKNPITITATLILLAVVIFLGIKLIPFNNNNQENNQSNDNFNSIRIIDGDTFETVDGKVFRLLCVDTPEIGSDGYEEASDYLSSIILGKNITIERDGFDIYNRTLAWVYVGNILVNKEIVDNGYGTLFEYNGTDCERMK